MSNIKNERLYSIWRNMKRRCNEPNRKDYKYYGGKGIKVCEEWSQSYAAFKEWAISNGYSDELTIDRIDFSKNYEPKNCRWIPFSEQRKNMSSPRTVSINGVKKPLKHWCADYGISYDCVCKRIYGGMDEISALLTPKRTNCEKRLETKLKSAEAEISRYKAVLQNLHGSESAQ